MSRWLSARAEDPRRSLDPTMRALLEQLDQIPYVREVEPPADGLATSRSASLAETRATNSRSPSASNDLRSRSRFL